METKCSVVPGGSDSVPEAAEQEEQPQGESSFRVTVLCGHALASDKVSNVMVHY